VRARWTHLIISILVPAAASIPASERATPGQTLPATNAAVAGQRAYIDPVTGKLAHPLPGQVQRALPVPGLAPDDSKMEVIHWPNGATQVRFHGQRQSTVYATLAKDGGVETHCVESTAELKPTTKP
jgi:hypothetical protein